MDEMQLQVIRRTPLDGIDHDDVCGHQVNHRKRNEQRNNQTEIDSNAYDQMRFDLSTPWLK